METIENPTRRHIGRNLQKVRVYLGVKQDTLASELGISQQSISNLEQQEEIEEGFLKKISDVLKVTPDLIKNFDLERAVYNINHNNYQDATIAEGATTFAIAQQINPIEKIIELYERLIKIEREKNDILQNQKS